MYDLGPFTNILKWESKENSQIMISCSLTNAQNQSDILDTAGTYFVDESNPTEGLQALGERACLSSVAVVGGLGAHQDQVGLGPAPKLRVGLVELGYAH